MSITPVVGEFRDSYSTQNLGQVPLDTGGFVPGGYGGIAFLDDDTLLVTGEAYSPEAKIYEVELIRDPDTNTIIGFAGPATFLANAPGIGSVDPDIEVGGLDGGLIVARNGTLLYTTYFDNSIGQILPGNSDPEPNAFINLSELGVDPPSTGALTIVPEGSPGAGRLKITSYDNGNFYDALLTENDDGTYSITIEGSIDLTPGENEDQDNPRGVEGPVYVDDTYSNFTTPSVIISQFDTSTLNAFEVDELGNPILETERLFLDGLSGNGGFLFGFIEDPVTGDFLASLDSAGIDGDEGRLLLIENEPPPTAVPDNDPFDSFTTLDISSGQAIGSGTVSISNDVYAFDAVAGELLTIDITATEVLNGIAYSNDDTQLYLYNETGDILAFSEDKVDSFASRVFNYLVPEDGTYYAAVTTAGNEAILQRGPVNQLLGFEETGLGNVAYDITIDSTDLPDTVRLFDIFVEADTKNPVGEVLIDGDQVLFLDLNGTRNTDTTGPLTIEVNAPEVNFPENTLDNTLVFEDTLSFGIDVFDFVLDFDEPFTSLDVDDIVDSLETAGGITAIVTPDELVQPIVFREKGLPGTPMVSLSATPETLNEDEGTILTYNFAVDGEIPDGGLTFRSEDLFDVELNWRAFNFDDPSPDELSGLEIVDFERIVDSEGNATFTVIWNMLEPQGFLKLGVVDDEVADIDSSFTVGLLSGPGYEVDPEANEVTIEVVDGIDNTGGPVISMALSSTEVNEGDPLTVTFTADGTLPEGGQQIFVSSDIQNALGDFITVDQNGNPTIVTEGLSSVEPTFSGFIATMVENTATISFNIFDDGANEGPETFVYTLLDGETYDLDENNTNSYAITIEDGGPLQVSLFGGPNYLIEDEGTVSAHAFNATGGVISEEGLVVTVGAPNLSEFDLDGVSVDGGEIVEVREGSFDLRMTEYTTLVNLPIADDGETETGEIATFRLASGDGYEVIEEYNDGIFNIVDTRSDIPRGVVAEPNDIISLATDTQITPENPSFLLLILSISTSGTAISTQTALTPTLTITKTWISSK
ncbi:PPC domain-containing protein [Crocosphaera watsonii]|uniref:Peptidase C-terminal archaeal/bacterial domain-containing protein n=3 Tax=Crocosphaera watsonii TaxID=263511 RepID=G5IYH3_CROWT|nr:PPC domain-containing protein [Crocosphaera watsonii]EHJ15014.1 hypothetical protein CWATWH0003_0322 [Crocosphaera watsonii WH 0003]